MSFADRVVRMRGQYPVVDEIEKTGDAESIAAHNVEIVGAEEVQRIGFPRASSLYGACMRLHVIGYSLNKTMRSWTNFKGKLIYGYGNAIHYWVQNEPDVFGDRRRGWWRCTACNKVRYFGKPPMKECKFCGARPEATVYKEHWLNLTKPYFVTGHPDMFLEKMKRMLRLVEMKTIAGAEFLKLAAPKIEHVWQLQTYMWGCSIDTKLPVKIDKELGYIMYFSKKHQAQNLPIKMFPVKANPGTLRRIKAKLKTFKVGIESYPDNLPECHAECTRGNFGNYRAKSCPTRKECMEGGDGTIRAAGQDEA